MPIPLIQTVGSTFCMYAGKTIHDSKGSCAQKVNGVRLVTALCGCQGQASASTRCSFCVTSTSKPETLPWLVRRSFKVVLGRWHRELAVKPLLRWQCLMQLLPPSQRPRTGRPKTVLLTAPARDVAPPRNQAATRICKATDRLPKRANRAHKDTMTQDKPGSMGPVPMERSTTGHLLPTASISRSMCTPASHERATWLH